MIAEFENIHMCGIFQMNQYNIGPLNTLIGTSAVIIERYHICQLVQKPKSVQGYIYDQ
jgi:hypothetical protein